MSLAEHPSPVPQLAPTSQAATRERFYRPELDGLRFFAFLVVFVGHSWRINPLNTPMASPFEREYWSWLWCLPASGNTAVDLFFVLSSYLITELLLREHDRSGRIDVPAFYARRALRIWPLYYFFLFGTWLLEAPLGVARGLNGAEFGWFAALLGNWSIVTSGHIPPSSTQILWTISVEEQFYLTWPLLVCLVRPKRIVWLAGALLIASNLARGLLVTGGASYTAINFNTFVRLDGIAWGALIAIALHGDVWQLPKQAGRWLACAGVLLALVTQRYLAPNPPSPSHVLLCYPLEALAAAMILLGVLRPKGEAEAWLTNPTMLYLGKISYGLYVWHLLVIVIAERFLPVRPGHWTAMLVTFPITVVIAGLSYRLLEMPFLRLKSKFAHVASREEKPA